MLFFSCFEDPFTIQRKRHRDAQFFFIKSQSGSYSKQSREDRPSRNGLGQKKIVFGSKDRAKEVKRKLESTYPLVDGRRFEILCSASKNELVLISPPTVGCSVSFLRDQSVLARATAYR